MFVTNMLILSVLCFSGVIARWKCGKSTEGTTPDPSELTTPMTPAPTTTTTEVSGRGATEGEFIGVKDEYTPKGKSVFVASLNMNVYETVSKSGKNPTRYLIAVYDINGDNDRIKQIADILAVSGKDDGFRVVVPDFFHGGPIKGHSWEGGIDSDVRKVISHYKDKATSFGIFGFCWGGRIAVKAGQEIPEIKGVGLIHPSGVVTADANTLKVPALLCPSGGEPDMLPFVEIAAKNLGSANVVHHRFDDMVHGFAGARGQWGQLLVRQRVDEVVKYAIIFFD